MNLERAPLTRWQLLCAQLVGRDVEILEYCPASERHDAIHDAVALLLLGLLEFGLWTFAMISFGAPWPVALIVAAIIATIIMALDVRLTASDNEPRGVFRRGRRGKVFFGFLAVRFALCFQLALGPAIALDLAVFRSEANARMEQDRGERNAPIMVEYDRKLAALEATRVGPIDAELAQLSQQRSQLLGVRARAEGEIDKGQGDRRDAELERSRQISGFGDRRAGRGELAIDAESRAALAAGQIEEARTAVANSAREAGALDARIAQLEARRTGLLAKLEPERRRLIAERDTRLIQSTDGVLTTFMGLVRLHQDPDRGTGLLLITLGMWTITMALELSFFLRVLFKAASVYDALLTIERQKRVALATHEFARILTGVRQRVPLRIVAASDS